MFIFGRTNGTLELHTFITSFTEKLHILSVRSTLGNSTAPQPLVVQLLLPSPSLPLHHLRWFSGYFLVFQLATWSAFRPFRGLSLKRSSNTSQRYGSPLLSSPSDLTYTCTQSSKRTGEEYGLLATAAHPPSWKSTVFTFVEATKKTFTVSIAARRVQGTTQNTWLLNWKRNQGRSTTRFIHPSRFLVRVAGYSFLIFKPRDVSGGPPRRRRSGAAAKKKITHSPFPRIHFNI